jgi:hypothetical protein
MNMNMNELMLQASANEMNFPVPAFGYGNHPLNVPRLSQLHQNYANMLHHKEKLALQKLGVRQINSPYQPQQLEPAKPNKLSFDQVKIEVEDKHLNDCIKVEYDNSTETCSSKDTIHSLSDQCTLPSPYSDEKPSGPQGIPPHVTKELQQVYTILMTKARMEYKKLYDNTIKSYLHKSYNINQVQAPMAPRGFPFNNSGKPVMSNFGATMMRPGMPTFQMGGANYIHPNIIAGAFSQKQMPFAFLKKLDFTTKQEVVDLETGIDSDDRSREDGRNVAKVSGSKKIKKLDLLSDDRKKSQSELLKNITKNYGKACSKFAYGIEGFAYLKNYVEDPEEIKEFQEYIKSNAENIKNIPFFRESILVLPSDPPKIAKFKQVFQKLCEVFVGKYAAKWIYSSKQLLNRRGHLSYRRKILRRIQDPHNFVNLNN